MITRFDSYKEHPSLVMDVLKYYRLERGDIRAKTVGHYCEDVAHLRTADGDGYDIDLVLYICRKLCEHDYMREVINRGGFGVNNVYLTNPMLKDDDLQGIGIQLEYMFNAAVYGFEYIYHIYKDKVVPIIAYDGNGEMIGMGTGFRYARGVATALHCLMDSDRGGQTGYMNKYAHVSIGGFSSKELNAAEVRISKSGDVDVAYIDLGADPTDRVVTDDAHILDEVLAMGYPRVPGYESFVTAEKATVSAIGRPLITTRGSVAAIEKSYLTKSEMLLITARIRGGNSGGPVINDKAMVVGVATSIPDSQGDYDDQGYGAVVPARELWPLEHEGEYDVLSLGEGFFVEEMR